MPHGLQVTFNSAGQHVATVNRLGYTTTFHYDAAGSLDTVRVPPSGGPYYACHYSGSAPELLDSISAPGPTARRSITMTRNGSQVLAIHDLMGTADSSSVQFSYLSTDPAISATRTNRLGVATSFGYGPGQQLASASINMGSGQAPITTTFRRADSSSLSSARSAVYPDSAYVRLDGPRTDVQDITTFWLDRFGQPLRIENALGQVTSITRANATWPALATRLQYPNGRTVGATYDARGNLATMTDSSDSRDSSGTCRYATTSYQWDQHWDFVTQTTLPEHEVSLAAYSATNGNRLWEQTGPVPDTTRRVHFGYNALGLLDSIKTPLVVHPEIISYDALGNADTVHAPDGFSTIYVRDAVGRIDTIRSLVDSATTLTNGKWLTQQFAYDGSDRDTLDVTAGPAVQYLLPYQATSPGTDSIGMPAQTLQVAKHYDREGDLIQLVRTDSDEPGMQLTTAWRYDAADRKVVEIAPNASKESVVYDPAGNVIEHLTRRGDTITLHYDPLNRLIERDLPAFTTQSLTLHGHQLPAYGATTRPADAEVFAYDLGGNLVMANNENARITRTYLPNGLLATDSIAVVSFDRTRWDLHDYVLQYRYDLDHRQRWLHHPAQLAPAGGDTVSYAYDSTTGLLRSVSDVAGHTVRYTYDAEERLAIMTAPDNLTTTYGYDDQAGNGALKSVHTPSSPMCVNLVSNGQITPYEVDPGVIFDDVLTRDAQDKVTRVTSQDQTLPYGYRRATSYLYSGLSAPTRSDDDTVYYNYTWPNCGQQPIDPSVRNTYTDWQPDAFGNILGNFYALVSPRGGTGQGTTSSSYDPTTLELLTSAYTSSVGLEEFRDTAQYNTASDRIYLDRFDSYDNHERWTASYYGATGQLYVADTRSNADSLPVITGGQQQYSYDALGRRLFTYSPFDSACPNVGCRTIIDRDIWDGDDLLYEIRYPADSSAS